MKTDRMGVYVLVSHLLITIAFLVAYVVFAFMGKDVTNLETILTVIIGYWFGAMGVSTIRPNTQTHIQSANEVKVTQPKEETKIGGM